jgi:hypothetical protein
MTIDDLFHVSYGQHQYNPRLCRIHSYFCPYEVLEPLWASKISQTILFSKPILLADAEIAQIRRKVNFSQISGIPTPRQPDANWLGSLRTPGQHRSVVVCQRKS